MFTLSYPCTCGYTPIYHFQVELVHLQLLGLALWPFPTCYYPYCLAPVAYHKLNFLLPTNRFPDLEKKMSVFFFFFYKGRLNPTCSEKIIRLNIIVKHLINHLV